MGHPDLRGPDPGPGEWPERGGLPPVFPEPTGWPDAPDWPPANGAYPSRRRGGSPKPLEFPPLDLPPRHPAAPAAPHQHPGDDEPTQVLRRYVPAHELLDREARELRSSRLRAAGVLPPHPPRAVLRRRRARRRMLEWPFLIVFALLAAFLIRSLALQTFYIPSASMHDTLLEGDRVLVNKVGYHLHAVRRGDVVVFRRPPNFQVEDEDLIKRVVALPGETVQARGRQVLINGRPLAEPYVDRECHGTDDFAPVKVPSGHLWMMGDNRCNSSDSRVFGAIDGELVVGRAFVLVWPPGRVAWL